MYSEIFWSVALTAFHIVVGNSAGTEESRSPQSLEVLQGNTAYWMGNRSVK